MTNYRQTMADALEHMYLMREYKLMERELTDAEKKKREEIAQDMDDGDFKKQYGDRWKEVKMAVATKQAKNESVELNEGDPFFGPVKGRKVKTVNMTHKTSGKEVVVVDNPKKIKEMEKLGFVKEEVDLDEAKQVLAHGGKGQYKAVSSGGVVDIMYKGKVISQGDFDRGADGWFLSIKGEKAQKFFGDAQEMVDYFAKNEITEKADLDEKIKRDQSYLKSYSDAVTHALDYTKSRGYEVDEDDFAAKVTHGPRKPSEGKTVSQRIDVTKGGKPQKKQLSFQVYNKGGKNPYELNVYVEDVELDERAREIEPGDEKAAAEREKKEKKYHDKAKSDMKARKSVAWYLDRKQGAGQKWPTGTETWFAAQDYMKKFKEDIDEGLTALFKKGEKIKVPWKGKLRDGKVVRYVPQRGSASPYYVVYVGEYQSIEVPAHKVKQHNEEVELDEAVSVKDFDAIKKGDTVTIKYESAMSYGTATFNVTAKNKVAKGQVEKVTMKSTKNPGGVKFFLYKRDNKVSFAIGDMGASVVSFKKEGFELDEGKGWQVWVKSPTAKSGWIPQGQPHKSKADAEKDAKNFGGATRVTKEEVELDEGYEKVVLNTLKDNDIGGYFSSGTLYVDMSDIEDAKHSMKIAMKRKDIHKIPKIVGEEVELTEWSTRDMKLLAQELADQKLVEGRMSDLHLLIKQGKSAKEIAKDMKVDVRTIKKLMVGYKESARSDAKKAMARDPDMKQGKFSKDVSATDADSKAASKNIIMQMRKVVSLRGKFKVEFTDGKKIKIPEKLAQAVQDKYNSIRKPRDKEKFQEKIAKSYKSMLNTLKEDNKTNQNRILGLVGDKIRERKNG